MLAAVAALSPAPKGFTVADLAVKVHATTGQTDTDYGVRQAAYDLRKLRAKNLVLKPGRCRRYHVTPQAIRTIVAISTLRDQVLEPLLGGLHHQPPVLNPSSSTAVEHDYQTVRLDIQTLFNHLGIATAARLVIVRALSGCCHWATSRRQAHTGGTASRR